MGGGSTFGPPRSAAEGKLGLLGGHPRRGRTFAERLRIETALCGRAARMNERQQQHGGGGPGEGKENAGGAPSSSSAKDLARPSSTGGGHQYHLDDREAAGPAAGQGDPAKAALGVLVGADGGAGGDGGGGGRRAALESPTGPLSPGLFPTRPLDDLTNTEHWEEGDHPVWPQAPAQPRPPPALEDRPEWGVAEQRPSRLSRSASARGFPRSRLRTPLGRQVLSAGSDRGRHPAGGHPGTSGPALASAAAGPKAFGIATLALRDKVAALERENETLRGGAAAAQAEAAEERKRSQALEERIRELEGQLGSEIEQKQCLEQTLAHLNSGQEGNAQLVTSLVEAHQRFENLTKEHEQLGMALQECDNQRRELTARYAFFLLDEDKDGLIGADDVQRFEMYHSYGLDLLRACLANWNFNSGVAGRMDLEDFVNFVRITEDKTSKEALNFWFGVLDGDCDGVIGRQDVKWLYDLIDKEGVPYCISFEDTICQIMDMAKVTDIDTGMTKRALKKCGLAPGIVGLLTNHANMLVQRSTAEWGRGDLPI